MADVEYAKAVVNELTKTAQKNGYEVIHTKDEDLKNRKSKTCK